jgi:hypothetical protein
MALWMYWSRAKGKGRVESKSHTISTAVSLVFFELT